jgi:hypothetical protein
MTGQQVRDDLGSTRPEAPLGLALPEIAFPYVEVDSPGPASVDPLALITAILADLHLDRPAIAGNIVPDDDAAAGAGAVAEPHDRLHSDEIRDNLPVTTIGVALF